MDKIERMLDANLNRSAEGLRVLEDIARFCLNDGKLTEKLKILRHKARKCLNSSDLNIIECRDADRDIGPSVSAGLGVEGKNNITELVSANFKRAQEAFRSLEEVFRMLGKHEISVEFESSRYILYSVEKEFSSALNIDKKLEVFSSGIYCITSEEHSLGRDNTEVISRMLSAGVKLIQYRDKSKSMLEKYRQCIRLREKTADVGAVFIVNDHIDLAKSVCADGVHLGQDDMPVAAARRLLGDGKIIGVSTHSPQQAEKAVQDGADYIGVGPIFRTYTKKDVCEPVGLEYLDYAVKNIKIPFVAIGGIKLQNIRDVLKRGAYCAALVTEITGADDIEGTIQNIRNILEGAC